MATGLTLEISLCVIEGALAKAAGIGCPPLAVVVLDAGGNDVAVQRQDRAGILRVDIARAKAWGALGMGYSSREIGERAQKMPVFFSALAAVSHGRMAPIAGGLLLFDAQRNVIGAVGISGDTPDRDEECAHAGLQVAGLVPQP